MDNRKYCENEAVYLGYTGVDGLKHFTSEDEIVGFFTRKNLDPHDEMEEWEAETLEDVAMAALENWRHDNARFVIVNSSAQLYWDGERWNQRSFAREYSRGETPLEIDSDGCEMVNFYDDGEGDCGWGDGDVEYASVVEIP